MSGEALARAAEALVGTRFRLHGRDPATGLDCLGVLACALAAIGRATPLPDDYRLRSRLPRDMVARAAGCGFVATTGPVLPGDVLIVRPSACQLHFIVAATGGRFIHAHAGLRRVIACASLPVWPVAGHWRLAATS